MLKRLKHSNFLFLLYPTTREIFSDSLQFLKSDFRQWPLMHIYEFNIRRLWKNSIQLDYGTDGSMFPIFHSLAKKRRKARLLKKLVANPFRFFPFNSIKPISGEHLFHLQGNMCFIVFSTLSALLTLVLGP